MDLSKAVVPISALPQRRSHPRDSGVPASFRASFSPKNALIWKPVFEKVIAGSPSPFSISEQLSGLRASTLNLNANDALKWLAECSPDEADRAKYSMLRQQISISKRPGEGIIIYYKRSVGNMIVAATTEAHVPKTWRDMLVDWLQTAQPEEVWDSRTVMSEPIAITTEDKTYILGLLVGLNGVEMDMQDTYVVIMR